MAEDVVPISVALAIDVLVNDMKPKIVETPKKKTQEDRNATDTITKPYPT